MKQEFVEFWGRTLGRILGPDPKKIENMIVLLFDL